MTSLPLAGIRILDASNLIAAPGATMILGDFGAEVIKIEHPVGGDQLRSHGEVVDGVPLWWTVSARNKRCVTLKLSSPEGRDIALNLASTADVVVENYRPGTFERWGLGYDALTERNPNIILAHVSGYGQDGPDRLKPGFGTVGEAMSGFAYRNGTPDGPPVLPPFGLADGVTALVLANAIQTALIARHRGHGGQEIDVAITEALLTILCPQEITYSATGAIAQRTGSQSPVNAPRNIYRTSDGRWVAISTSTTSTAVRLMELVGAADFVAAAWFSTAKGRAAHADELNGPVVEWIGVRERSVVLNEANKAQVPIASVNSIEDVMAEPQYIARDALPSVAHPVLGHVRMPGVYYRLSKTPGRIQWPGPSELGPDNAAVFGEIGLNEAAIADLSSRGVI